MLSVGMSMTSGFDSDHHMEWSVNMTRHEIANLSHRGNICASWYGKRTIVRQNAERRRGAKRQCESRTARGHRCGKPKQESAYLRTRAPGNSRTEFEVIILTLP